MSNNEAIFTTPEIEERICNIDPFNTLQRKEYRVKFAGSKSEWFQCIESAIEFIACEVVRTRLSVSFDLSLAIAIGIGDLTEFYRLVKSSGCQVIEETKAFLVHIVPPATELVRLP